VNTIRPIETVYNGYRFRSRLEARWAVFFNTLDVPYSYEPEGFELGEGIRYLPDFWLPDQRCWVEIKPPGEWVYHHECQLLAMQSECRLVLYITGNPWPGEYGIAPYPMAGDEFRAQSPWLFALGRRSDRELWICNDYVGADCLNRIISGDSRYPLADAPRLIGAYRAARQARFEFGRRKRSDRRTTW
jgi:hypothetical protein